MNNLIMFVGIIHFLDYLPEKQKHCFLATHSPFSFLVSWWRGPGIHQTQWGPLRTMPHPPTFWPGSWKFGGSHGGKWLWKCLTLPPLGHSGCWVLEWGVLSVWEGFSVSERDQGNWDAGGGPPKLSAEAGSGGALKGRCWWPWVSCHPGSPKQESRGRFFAGVLLRKNKRVCI